MINIDIDQNISAQTLSTMFFSIPIPIRTIFAVAGSLAILPECNALGHYNVYKEADIVSMTYLTIGKRQLGVGGETGYSPQGRGKR